MRAVIGFTLAMACGLGIFFFPGAVQWNNERASHRIVGAFNSASGAVGVAHADLLTEAKAYNRALTEYNISDPTTGSAATDKRYQSQLRIPGTDVMATLTIPNIGTSIPVFHTASQNGLDRGAEHLYGSALPVGGIGTHAVITAHSNASHARLFNDLHNAEIGDEFYLQAAGQLLRYQVDRITVIHPDDVAELQPIPDGDYVTLVTCTPIGINSHRLLVRGTRIDLPITASAPTAATGFLFPWWALWYLLGVAASFGIGLGLTRLAGGKRALRSTPVAAVVTHHARPTAHAFVLPALVLALLAGGMAPASAPSVPGTGTVTLTVYKHPGPGVAAATAFTATQVLGDASGVFDLSTTAGWDHVLALTAATIKSPSYGTSQTVSAAGGRATFNLSPGLYLITQADGSSGVAAPTLIAVPSINPDTHQWAYQITAELKTQPNPMPRKPSSEPAAASTALAGPPARRLMRTGVPAAPVGIASVLLALGLSRRQRAARQSNRRVQ